MYIYTSLSLSLSINASIRVLYQRSLNQALHWPRVSRSGSFSPMA